MTLAIDLVRTIGVRIPKRSSSQRNPKHAQTDNCSEPLGTQLKNSAGETLVTASDGDTMVSIAARHGVPTAELLAANKRGWKTTVNAGDQVVIPNSTRSNKPPAQNLTPLEIKRHTITVGDTLGGIAAAHGLTAETLLTANGLHTRSFLIPGHTIVVPHREA